MAEQDDHDIGFFDVGAACPDLVIFNGDLKGEKGLETAVLISLFSDQFVPLADLPEGRTFSRGWWADRVSVPEDDEIGSKLWTVEREKVLDDTANAIEEITVESLQWLIDDGVASSVEAVVEIVNSEQIRVEVEILKPDGENIPFRFAWDGQELKADIAAA